MKQKALTWPLWPPALAVISTPSGRRSTTAGNLLGEEPSGHIKEVGFELYQQMLEEAVAEVRDDDEIIDTDWSPQISVGTITAMIPDDRRDRTCLLEPGRHVQLLVSRVVSIATAKDLVVFGQRGPDVQSSSKGDVQRSCRENMRQPYRPKHSHGQKMRWRTGFQQRLARYAPVDCRGLLRDGLRPR